MGVGVPIVGFSYLELLRRLVALNDKYEVVRSSKMMKLVMLTLFFRGLGHVGREDGEK